MFVPILDVDVWGRVWGDVDGEDMSYLLVPISTSISSAECAMRWFSVGRGAWKAG